MRKLPLSIILFLCIAINGAAQNGFSNYLNTLPGASVRTTIELDGFGNKWFGSSNKGAYKFDGSVWISYDTVNSGIVSNIINDIAFDNSGNAWFATREGVSKFNGTTWTTFTKLNSGLPSDSTYCLFVQSSDIWIGTKQGLAKFDGSTWTILNTANSGLVDNYVTTLNIHSNGDVYIGTNKGLCIKSAASWEYLNGNNSNLVSSYINDVHFESPTRTWVVTKYNGVFLIENNFVFSLSSLLTQKQVTPTGFMNTISRGPQGGVLFGGKHLSQDGFIEIVNDQLFFYSFPNLLYGSQYHTYDSINGRVWFIKSSGTNYLFSWDYSSFSGVVLLQDNPNVKRLDINMVNTGLMNTGQMNWDLDEPCYEVPKNSGRNAINNSSLWIGGKDDQGTLHLSASMWGSTGNDFWPGPLDTITGSTDDTVSGNYDRIWKLDRWQIDEFRTMFANGSVTSGAYTPHDDIIDWPAQGANLYSRNLAPFVDVNGDGIYDPINDGDYPKIKGDQMCYWIFNDNLYNHTESGGIPFKAEIHASAYAYTCEDIDDSLKVLNYTTFYSFDIFNRDTHNYHNVYIGMFSDPQLGGYHDDYSGCNPSGNYSFDYNGDDYDQTLTGVLGYGDAPPIFSKLILKGPLAEANDSIDNNNDGVVDESNESNLMTHYHAWVDGNGPATNTDPTYPQAYYNLMHSIWNIGDPLTYGGNGYGGTIPTNFRWDGIPGDTVGWSLLNMGTSFGSFRTITSSGPFNFSAGERVSFDFAYVFTQDKSAASYNINDLYYKNWDDVKRIQRWYAADSFPSCDPQLSTSVKDVKSVSSDLNIYPNPSSDLLYLNYKTDSRLVTIEIYDVRGQLLKSMKMNAQSTQAISLADLSSGLYLLKMNDGKNTKVQRFVKQ